MEQLPVSLNLKGRKVVVTGGGTVAARKAELALRAGAYVLVVAPMLGNEFVQLERHAGFSHRAGELEASDLAGALVAFGCCEDHAMDERLRELAHAAGALVNVPDRPVLCDFTMPSILDRSPLLVAISSGGASPLLTRLIKERLESSIPAAFGDLAEFLRGTRDRVDTRFTDLRARRHFLETIVDGPVADLVLAGDLPRANERLDAELDAWFAQTGDQPVGEVYLVGGGPGDPDLLTFRALRLIQRADVVVYDRLIGSPILNLVRRDAERIYVGKMKDKHELSQEDISRLLVKLAREGRRVLRLKGGDPFIFGRGGEEIEMLAEAGIPFQVVPGVTAAAGCASYAGIPLTHRDHAQTCIFVTGHAKYGRPEIEWQLLLQPRQTVAIYMGLAALPGLTQEFLARGADPSLPVAIVENGTRPNQKVVTGSIASIAANAAHADLKGPAMIIIGAVVGLREKLAWFKTGERAPNVGLGLPGAIVPKGYEPAPQASTPATAADQWEKRDMAIEFNGTEIETTATGYLSNIEDWTEELARHMAALDALELTGSHWDVINYLRDEYINNNQTTPNTRTIVKTMSEKWGRNVDQKELYDLFPGDPSKQAGRIAGLPESRRKGGY